MHVTVIIMLILAILLVIFTLQNSFEVTINIFFWEIQNAPMVLVLFICIMLGYILSAVYFYRRIWKLERKYKHALQANKKHEPLRGEPKKESHPEGIELEPYDDDDDDN